MTPDPPLYERKPPTVCQPENYFHVLLPGGYGCACGYIPAGETDVPDGDPAQVLMPPGEQGE